MKMHIKNIDVLRDGGTVEIKTDDKTFYIDRRISGDRNPSRNMLFESYPNDKEWPLPKSEAKEIRKELLSALKEFGVQSQKYQTYLPLIQGIVV